MPGPPQQTELAYLAALVDRSGTFCASAKSATIGIKITGPPALRHWLVLRFGGTDSTRAWTLSRQADVRYVATGILRYLVVKQRAGAAFVELLDHVALRESYHGTAEWRTKRDQLKGAVRLHLSPRSPGARAEPSPGATRPDQRSPRP